MASEVLVLFEYIFGKCIDWLEQIYSAVGAWAVILPGLCIFFAVMLIFMPIRGSFGSGNMNDLVENKTYKGKYDSGKRTGSNAKYKGKYER